MSYRELHDFVSHWQRQYPIIENYGEVVAKDVMAAAHKDSNILGVFYYNVNASELIYSDVHKSHAAFPEHDVLMSLPQDVVLLRGRVVNAGDKMVAMVYLAGDARDPSQSQLVQMLHQIVRRSGLPIEYVVDDAGRSLLSEAVLKELEC